MFEEVRNVASQGIAVWDFLMTAIQLSNAMRNQ